MSNESKTSVKVAKGIMYVGLFVAAVFVSSWLSATVIWSIDHHPRLLIASGVVVWLLATAWYLLQTANPFGFQKH